MRLGVFHCAFSVDARNVPVQFLALYLKLNLAHGMKIAPCITRGIKMSCYRKKTFKRNPKMANQGMKNVESFLGNAAAGSLSGAVSSARDVLSSVDSALEATPKFIKEEVAMLTKEGGKLIERARAEVSRHPITYAFACAGVGMILGASLAMVYGAKRR